MAVLMVLFDTVLRNKQQRRSLNWVIHFWSRLAMFVGTRCTLYGKENLPAPGETVVYVPNRSSLWTSWRSVASCRTSSST